MSNDQQADEQTNEQMLLVSHLLPEEKLGCHWPAAILEAVATET